MEMFTFGEPLDIATRHPSPWHQLSHSLSPSALPSHSPSPRRTSSNGSLALTSWDQQLVQRTSDVKRSQLVLGPASSIDDTSNTNTSDGDVPRTPKLEAERDKEGHIEYKLKLIDPCPERFERLVTQMKWRLSQGGNEAIYEIGLHDDGSVIGLTRNEMDASLRTLELMASELGATVMILQEIVIVSPSSTSPTRRNDLYADGMPKKGTKAVVGLDVLEYVPPLRMRQRMRPVNVGEGGKVDKNAKYQEKMRRRAAVAAAAAAAEEEGEGEHTPFVMDVGGWKERRKKAAPKATIPSPPPSPTKMKGNDARRRRAQERRERRHADLLAGDGCTPDSTDGWLAFDLDISVTAEQEEPVAALTSANLIALTHTKSALHSLSLSQVDPTRASSLRLAASPVGSPPLEEMQAAPLDSVSLSFADVRTVTGDEPLSEDDDGTEVLRPVRGEEMICVEALVIRKGQQDEYVDFDWYQQETGSDVRGSEQTGSEREEDEKEEE